MKEIGLFKTLDNKNLTNKTMIVTFFPSENVSSYSYQIYHENSVIQTSPLQTSTSNISLENSGKYKIVVTAKLNNGQIKKISSDEYTIDKDAPIIEVKSNNLVIKKSIKDSIMNNVKAYDKIDGNIAQIETKYDNLKRNESQKLTYIVYDRAGNKTTKDINVTVVKYNYSFVIFSFILALILIIIYFFNQIYNAIMIEKRIDSYILKPINKKEISLSEKIIKKYKILTKKISNYLDKSVFANKYSHKFEKYLSITDIHNSGKEIIAGKIIVALIFVIISIIVKILSIKMIDFYEIILIFSIGFFALDALYFIKYKIYRKKIENDFTSAITIMNNAFKSGRSITQAIDTVSRELKGPVGEEFNRMSLELLYGLGIDVVFKRFAKRIDLEEANYLTASLTILNKTGGDIIKVFDSIEKNMFDKKKLRLELLSLTSGSRIVVGVLLGMPFFFSLVIGLINPEYFIPFFTTNIGIILLIFMIIYYIIFVVVVRKVMKVVI